MTTAKKEAVSGTHPQAPSKLDRIEADFKQEINEARRCLLDLYWRVDEAQRGLCGIGDMAECALREATGALLNVETAFLELQYELDNVKKAS